MGEFETLSEGELARHRAELLPTREAMSLISTGSSLLPAYDDGAALVDGAGGAAGTGATETASGAAGDVSTLATADASGTEPSTVEGDRTDAFSSTDTAYAGPS